MPTVTKSALVLFPAAAMFDLVADVERYPDFLPWCGGTVVHERTADTVVASITIAFKGLRQTFTTANTLERPTRMGIALRDGPFSSLSGQWQFRALREDACRIDLALDYEMKSGVLAALLGPLFGQIANSMVDAFVRRAEATLRRDDA